MLTLTTVALPEIAVAPTDRDRYDEARRLVIEALRANGPRQIRSKLANGHGGFCFVGLAAAVLDHRPLD